MKLGIRLHLAGFSLSKTISERGRFGVERSRPTVDNWVQKADLQPTEAKNPDHVAVDETTIRIDDQRDWLYAAVDTETNKFLHVRLTTAQNLGLLEIFFHELRDLGVSHVQPISARRCSGTMSPNRVELIASSVSCRTVANGSRGLLSPASIATRTNSRIVSGDDQSRENQRKIAGAEPADWKSSKCSSVDNGSSRTCSPRNVVGSTSIEIAPCRVYPV